MDAKTYLHESARTAAGEYHADLVDPAQMDFMLQAVVANGHWADRIKRALFYAKVGDSVASRWSTTSLSHNPELKDLVHAMLGCVTESAEIAEHVRDVLTGTKPLDIVNIREELGDLLWYIALALRSIDSDFEEAFAVNIAKLRARFPDKFVRRRAVERDLDKERAVLESTKPWSLPVIAVRKNEEVLKSSSTLTMKVVQTVIHDPEWDPQP